VQGTLAGVRGGLALVSLAECRVSRGDTILFRPEWGRYDLAVGETVTAGWAGPADPCYWPETAFSDRCIPIRKQRRPREALLIALYREALALWAEPEAPGVVPGFRRIAGELEKRFPEEWLLRWNLLECLCKLGRGDEPFVRELREQLLEIEARNPREVPISMGLRFLGQLPV
jgi:phenylalanine-4-hydroxylase